MKILFTSNDLYSKVNQRPSYKEIVGLRAKCVDDVPNSNPFGKYLGMKAFEKKLAKKFQNMGAINYPQYLILKYGQHIKEVLSSIKLIIKGSLDVMELESKEVKSEIFSVDLERSYPHVFGEIYLVGCYKNRININLKLLVRAAKVMLHFRMCSLFHAIQFLRVKDTVNIINKNKRTFIIEEGINTFITYVMYCNKRLGGKVIVTQKQVLNECSPTKYYDELYSNNGITNQININAGKNAKHIQFDSEINIEEVGHDKRSLGYAVDIGTMYLNINDKNIYDTAMNTISDELGFELIYSIHPQEKPHKEAYYENRFSALSAEYRGEKSLEEFFSEIDILVVWWSTLVSQAITCGKFVILLDFFDDRQGIELERLVPRVVKRAKNKDNLMNLIKDFRSISENTRQEYFTEANKLVFKAQ